jgi:hypothetical protein
VGAYSRPRKTAHHLWWKSLLLTSLCVTSSQEKLLKLRQPQRMLSERRGWQAKASTLGFGGDEGEDATGDQEEEEAAAWAWLQDSRETCTGRTTGADATQGIRAWAKTKGEPSGLLRGLGGLLGLPGGLRLPQPMGQQQRDRSVLPPRLHPGAVQALMSHDAFCSGCASGDVVGAALEGLSVGDGVSWLVDQVLAVVGAHLSRNDVSLEAHRSPEQLLALLAGAHRDVVGALAGLPPAMWAQLLLGGRWRACAGAPHPTLQVQVHGWPGAGVAGRGDGLLGWDWDSAGISGGADGGRGSGVGGASSAGALVAEAMAGDLCGELAAAVAGPEWRAGLQVGAED